MLRLARPEDVSSISAILDAPHNWDKLETYPQAAILAALRDPEHLLFAWRAENFGFAWMRISGPREIKLEEFGVSTPGGGVGRQFFTALLEQLRMQDDHDLLWLLVAADNDGAIRFYDRFGFSPAPTPAQQWERRKGPPVAAKRMELRLR